MRLRLHTAAPSPSAAGPPGAAAALLITSCRGLARHTAVHAAPELSIPQQQAAAETRGLAHLQCQSRQAVHQPAASLTQDWQGGTHDILARTRTAWRVTGYKSNGWN